MLVQSSDTLNKYHIKQPQESKDNRDLPILTDAEDIIVSSSMASSDLIGKILRLYIILLCTHYEWMNEKYILLSCSTFKNEN